jgi:MFS transporter, PAT family, beta-lactamase induction signal transducer AmpG
MARWTQPPVWLFGITNIPLGVVSGYTSVAMPFILRQAGVPMASIASASAAMLLPLAYQFLWAPMLDLGLQRRTWLMLMAALSGLAVTASLFLKLPEQYPAYVALCVAAQAFSGMVSAGNGALIATRLPAESYGRASGWLNAAYLGGNAIGGGLAMELAGDFGNPVAGLALGLLCFLPSLAALWLSPQPPQRGAAAALFGGMLREAWTTARSRRGWTGILFCIAPVATPALLDLFSAVGEDYQAKAGTVELSMGYASGLATVVGALASGRWLDRHNRRYAYIFSGVLLALVDLAMAVAPAVPATYVAGTLAYSLVSGICYAAFSAMVLEIIGDAKHSAASQYTLFDCAGNMATSYLAWVDGHGYDWFKARGVPGAAGMLYSDAGMNLIGAAVLILLMLLAYAGRRRAAGQPA